jgi:Tfp pilus assembly protein PilO
MNLLSVSASNASGIFIQSTELRNKLTALYSTLATYRKHEARAAVLSTLQKQLQDAKEFEILLEQ